MGWALEDPAITTIATVIITEDNGELWEGRFPWGLTLTNRDRRD